MFVGNHAIFSYSSLNLSRWAFTTALPFDLTSLTQTNALLEANMMLLSSSLEIQDNNNAVFADMTYHINSVLNTPTSLLVELM